MNNQFEEQQIDILDIIAILSFIIGLDNLQENRQQSKTQEQIIKSIEEHLKRQDDILHNQNEKYLNKIISLLERRK